MDADFEPHLYAITTPGLEPITAKELRDLGATGVEPAAGGVRFDALDGMMERSNLWLRTASRVLSVAAGGRARAWSALERLVERTDWDALLPRGAGVRVRVAASRSRLYHERGIRERVLGVLDRAPGGPDDPEVWVRVHEDRVTISLDTSGDLLHRRGYRVRPGSAPLRETLAAGVLLGAGWDPATPLLDPMCGSGTFVVEGAWIAQRRAPGLTRGFEFERRPAFRRSTWERILQEGRAVVRPAESLPEIVGVDRDPSAVDAAEQNARWAEAPVRIECADIADVGSDGPPGLIVVNPPYGRRLGHADEAFRAVESLLSRMPGWRAVVLYAPSGRLPRGWTSLMRLSNGGVGVRVVQRSGRGHARASE